MNLLRWAFVCAVLAVPTVGCVGAHYGETGRNESRSPSVPVHWQDITTEKEFWQAIYDHPKVIVLFGSKTCGPCHSARQWWESKSAPSSWAFIYWETDTDQNDELTPRVNSIVLAFGTAAKTLPIEVRAFPVLSAIEGAHGGAPIKDVVSMAFTGYDDCTTALQSWLSFRPNGLKP
jgi:hypothetical protein